MEVLRFGHAPGADPVPPEQPVFYYDLGDPECYLVAEALMHDLPVVPEWEPVWAPELTVGGEVGRNNDVCSRFFGQAPDSGERTRVEGIGERTRVEQRAAELGLQPVRWPEPWPPDSREAMLAATYAKRIGRVVAFSLAAFRQAFAGGRDLGDRDTILIAGAACEMHPAALLKGIALRSVGIAIDHARARARGAGVSSLPAIQVGDQVFEGEGLVGAAADALAWRAAR